MGDDEFGFGAPDQAIYSAGGSSKRPISIVTSTRPPAKQKPSPKNNEGFGFDAPDNDIYGDRKEIQSSSTASSAVRSPSPSVQRRQTIIHQPTITARVKPDEGNRRQKGKCLYFIFMAIFLCLGLLSGFLFHKHAWNSIFPKKTGNETDCKGEWSKWTDCGNQCGLGTRFRYWSIIQEAQNGGKDCVEEGEVRKKGEVKSEECNSQKSCVPENCQEAWSTWTDCRKGNRTIDCGSGTKFRYRKITKEALNGGIPCSNKGVESKKCSKEKACLDECVNDDTQSSDGLVQKWFSLQNGKVHKQYNIYANMSSNTLQYWSRFCDRKNMSLVSFSYDEEYKKVRDYLKSITTVREDGGRANIGPNKAYGYYTSGHTFKEGSETRIEWSSKFSIGHYISYDTSDYQQEQGTTLKLDQPISIESRAVRGDDKNFYLRNPKTPKDPKDLLLGICEAYCNPPSG